jgi:UDPglucose--hexose-1-phosphate uridylyltransferase
MKTVLLHKHPHRRLNPLTGEWVLVSPHRAERPWLGQHEIDTPKELPRYDESCYLCPGNERVNGKLNPSYTKTFVFTNDFPALTPNSNGMRSSGDLFCSEEIGGQCRVVCYSPRHDLTLSEFSEIEIVDVIRTWIREYTVLSKKYQWVQIFENKGEIMGCSNPHPHGQIWASNILPNEAIKESNRQVEYKRKTKSILLSDYRDIELANEERVIAINEHWVVIVPYWAIWPYETILLPKTNRHRLDELGEDEIVALAAILKILLTKYDNLFTTSFPYTMGWHNEPSDQIDEMSWLLHAHYYPPLLCSATVKKFMVGYEMLSEVQRDIPAEQAAALLKKQSTVHYK